MECPLPLKKDNNIDNNNNNGDDDFSTKHLLNDQSFSLYHHSPSLISMMKDIIRDKNFTLAISLLDKSPITTHPPLVAHLITRMGQLDLVEAALKIYKTYSVTSPTSINTFLQTSLIGLLVRRKENVSAAFDEMDKWILHLKSSSFNENNFKHPPLMAQNHLLIGCAKIGDLSTAISIWNGILKNYSPDVYSYSSFFWALASSTGKGKKFNYSLSKKEIIDTATKVWERMLEDASIIVDPPSISAILSVYCNMMAIGEAESIFNKFAKSSNNPFHHELMFLMYSKRKDLWYSALALWMNFVNNNNNQQIILPLEGWRAIVKSATMANELEYACEILEKMVLSNGDGKKAIFKDFIFLHMRLCESGRRDLIIKIRSLFEGEKKRTENRVLSFRKRSVAVGDLLSKIMGPKDAPKIYSEERSRLPNSEIIKNRIRKSGNIQHMYEYSDRPKYSMKSMKTLSLNK